MTQPARTGRPANRSVLESPWLAAGLGVVVLALAAVILLPGLLGSSGFGGAPTQAAGQPTPNPSPAEPTFLRPTPSPQPSFVAYVVKPGDTLNSIAKHFQTTGRSIAWWSRGAHPSLDPESSSYNPNRLKVGWVLQVLPGTVVDDNNPPTPSPASPG
jgi:LysM domain